MSRVHLRQWSPQETKLLQEASYDAYICNMIGLPRYSSPQQARDWIQRRHRSEKSRVIVDSASQEAIGEVGLFSDSSGCWGQLFYWILSKARGRGLVVEAVELLLRQTPRLVVTAFVSDRNLASRRVLAKLGFVRAARNER